MRKILLAALLLTAAPAQAVRLNLRIANPASNLTISSITVTGDLGILGAINTQVTINGSSLTVNGTIQAGTLYSTGTANVEGAYQIGGSTILATGPGDASLKVGRGAGILSVIADGVFIGRDSGNSATSATRQTCVGAGSCDSNVSSSEMTAVGWFAGSGQTGAKSVWIGSNAGFGSGSGVSNVGVGHQAGGGATGISSENTFIGEDAGTAAGVKNRNTMVGRESGRQSTSAEDDTFVGYRAGNNNTTGDRNTILGHDMSNPNATDSDKLLVGSNGVRIIGGDIDTGAFYMGPVQGIAVTTRTADGAMLISSSVIVGLGMSDHTAALNVTDIGANRENYIVAFSSKNQNPLWALHPDGHVEISGADPTLGTCNNGAIGTLSSDSGGTVAISGANTSCAVNFNSAWDAEPLCLCGTVDSAPSLCRIDSLSTTVLTMSPSSALGAGDSYTYRCWGTHAE